MTEGHDDFRPAWIDYWKAPHPVAGQWPAFNPTWRKAEHQHGVGFYAPWEDPWSGFPEHARRCAIALASTRLPVHLRSQRGGMQMNEADDLATVRAKRTMREALLPLLEADVKFYDTEIFQIVASPQNFFRLAGPTHHWMEPKMHLAALQFRIISTVFERDRLSRSERECLQRVGQVWVATTKDYLMLLDQGIPPERLGQVPIPYFPTDPHLSITGKRRLAGPPRFYHIGKWEPRKEQRNIIGAFLQAFSPGEAKLYLKTSLGGPKLDSGYPQSPEEATTRWLGDERVKAKGWSSIEVVNGDVKIIRQRLSTKQMLQLHRQCDAYVTLSRGEGFDMPAFDAMLSGNALLYTESGGPQDFARPSDLCVRSTGTVPCDPFYGWGAAHYEDYDFDEAVDGYKRLAAQIQQGANDTKMPVPPRIEEEYSAVEVGKRMRSLVEALRTKNLDSGIAQIYGDDEAEGSEA